jgi:VWFA-related protein
VTGVLWAAALATALVGGDGDGPQPVFGASIGAVRLDVSIGRDGQLVTGLSAADFEVKDDGVVQDIELVTGSERALQAVLVLDTSSSVAGRRLASLKRAASSFIAGLSPEDAASVIAFSHRVYALPPDPYDHERLRAGVEDLTSGGATALNDAVVAGLLRSTTGRGRPMLLIFSDGQNSLSWLGQRQVLQAARELDAVVYGIVATSDGRNQPPRGGLLGELADLTGGTVLAAGEGDLTAAFQRILASAQDRYVMRYTPRGVKEAGWHAVQVRLKRGKGEVRVRSGYRR